MANYRILTNNPAVQARYPEAADYQAGTVRDIFIAVRNAVHQGAVLISHPLAGSIKPNESPYKSVLLSRRKGPVDARSLAIMEDAMDVLQKLPEKQHQHAQGVLEDFITIDLDLVLSAMQALPAAYY